MGNNNLHKRVRDLQIFSPREINCTPMGDNNLLIPIMVIETTHKRVKFPSWEIICMSVRCNNLTSIMGIEMICT